MTPAQITLEALIRWRSRNIGSTDPGVVADSLSTEVFHDDQVALHQVEALRKFRKLRQAARLRWARRVLIPQPTNPPTIQRSARDELIYRLTAWGEPPHRSAGFVDALERLIDERLTHARPWVPQPSTMAARELSNMQFRGSPFRWIAQTQMVEECWVGPLVVGSVAAVVGNFALYEPYFGTHGANLEKLPGQHAIHVAKKRVEERYREWARNALNVNASV